MADDRRISSLLGGIARSVGPSDQDIRSLQRRREEHERKTPKKPVKAFDVMLDNERQASERDQKRRRQARGEQTEDERDPKDKDAPRKPPLPRGRGRLIRG